ncbi:hypothetical protein PAPYR_11879 [Paratrimastix pyriformis]|uniref:Uncharacterized protein n=1 Tax=Paratrimastix pyriformis TaxID=342808 RepID=A0ABQ8U2V7_9EUKA|nr:hypothetical protein PAPYR_11879 [Paratrimastix pyriformis]
MKAKRGTTVVKMPPELLRYALAQAYISRSEYLLPSTLNTVMNSQFVQKIREAFGNNGMSVDVIRMIFSTTFVEARYDPRVAKYMDEVMGHNADTHNAIYIKRCIINKKGETEKISEEFIRGGEGAPQVTWMSVLQRQPKEGATSN